MPTVVGDCDQQPIDVRRGSRIPMRTSTETRVVPNPGDFQIPEIRSCDFVTDRITRMPGVTTEVGPVSILHSGQLGTAHYRQGEQADQSEHTRYDPA